MEHGNRLDKLQVWSTHAKISWIQWVMSKMQKKAWMLPYARGIQSQGTQAQRGQKGKQGEIHGCYKHERLSRSVVSTFSTTTSDGSVKWEQHSNARKHSTGWRGVEQELGWVQDEQLQVSRMPDVGDIQPHPADGPAGTP